MNWRKLGQIYSPARDGGTEFPRYAAIPTPIMLDDGNVRVFFSPRDEKNRSQITFVDLKAENPCEILQGPRKRCMALGRLGTFDDSGIMPCSLVRNGDELYLYYIGWNPQVTVSYRTSIGLAVSRDEGLSFQRETKGPILDRDANEPYFNTGPCVVKKGNEWLMWYSSCTGWEIIAGKPEPRYLIKMATSKDGVNWSRVADICLGYTNTEEALGRPCVFSSGGRYTMLYSSRRLAGYRETQDCGYRIRSANSLDGTSWTRSNEARGLEPSASGWDSTMVEYAATLVINDKRYLFYNGNSFGETGFGCAVHVP